MNEDNQSNINLSLTTDKSVNSNHYVMKLLVLVIFLLVGVIGYLYFQNLQLKEQIILAPVSATPTIFITSTPPTDSTFNWRIYTTTNSLGISFKYPNDWIITEKNNYVIALKDPDLRAIVGACPGYSLSISKYDPLANYARFDTVVKSVLDGQSVEKWENKNADCKENVIFVNKLPSEAIKPRYIISFVSKNPDYDNIFNQILATFQFTKSDRSLDTYTACGCVCCGGSVPEDTCLYKSRGDDLNIIIEEDTKLKNSPQCNSMGCNRGTVYKYCD